MVEYIPYFAAVIMVIFGIAFYSAMLTFRKMTDEKVEVVVNLALDAKEKPQDPRNN